MGSQRDAVLLTQCYSNSITTLCSATYRPDVSSAKVCKVFQAFYRCYNFGKQLYFSKGIAVLFWGGYLKRCNHRSVITAIKTHTSTYAGREISHTMRSYLHATTTESLQLSVPISPCQSPWGAGSAWGPGFLLTALLLHSP